MLRSPSGRIRTQLFQFFRHTLLWPEKQYDIIWASRTSRVMCESASANRAGTPRWRNDDGPFGENCSRGRPSGKDGRLSFPGKVLANNDRQQTKKGKKDK